MNVSFRCGQCERLVQLEFDESTAELVCDCGARVAVPPGAVRDGRLERCLVCPSRELYTRKDFPQGLGLAIVVAGFAISCIPWYYHNWLGTFAVLFATALIDAILYLVTGEMLQCYRCHAQYRGLASTEGHQAFDLEVHERHRQQRARLRQMERAQRLRQDGSATHSP